MYAEAVKRREVIKTVTISMVFYYVQNLMTFKSLDTMP